MDKTPNPKGTRLVIATVATITIVATVAIVVVGSRRPLLLAIATLFALKYLETIVE